MSHDIFEFMSQIDWFWLMVIVAIICGCVSGTVRMRHQHLERMELIRQGMNPDGGKPLTPREI